MERREPTMKAKKVTYLTCNALLQINMVEWKLPLTWTDEGKPQTHQYLIDEGWEEALDRHDIRDKYAESDVVGLLTTHDNGSIYWVDGIERRQEER
jgi:hypothetical protein